MRRGARARSASRCFWLLWEASARPSPAAWGRWPAGASSPARASAARRRRSSRSRRSCRTAPRAAAASPSSRATGWSARSSRPSSPRRRCPPIFEVDFSSYDGVWRRYAFICALPSLGVAVLFCFRRNLDRGAAVGAPQRWTSRLQRNDCSRSWPARFLGCTSATTACRRGSPCSSTVRASATRTRSRSTTRWLPCRATSSDFCSSIESGGEDSWRARWASRRASGCCSSRRWPSRRIRFVRRSPWPRRSS